MYQPWYPQQGQHMQQAMGNEAWDAQVGAQQQHSFPQQQPLMQPQFSPQQMGMGAPPYFSAEQYQVPGFVQQQMQPPLFTPGVPGGGVPGQMLPIEQSFIENILRLNRGKVATFYMTYENNVEWNARVFRGVVEEAGRDHIIVGDLQDQTHWLLLMVNLDYVEFDEPIEYTYPFGGLEPFQLTQYPPR